MPKRNTHRCLAALQVLKDLSEQQIKALEKKKSNSGVGGYLCSVLSLSVNFSLF